MLILLPSGYTAVKSVGRQASTSKLPARDTVSFGGREKKCVGATWDPGQYLKFEAPRLRPALDLLARIPLDKPDTIYDLGCGTGNVTQFIHQRWPEARITGIDNSQEMLDAAAKTVPGLQLKLSDADNWKPPRGRKADLIYSNATLHWLPRHDRLFPKLMRYLKPGGVLAVQMPRNFDAPSHRLIKEVAESGSWREILKTVLRDTPVLDPSAYYRILRPHCDSLDIWEAEYLQELSGENPVAEFTKGTWLKPVLDALEEPMRSRFEAEYRRHILQAYPPEPNGKTLFPFRRLFILATSKS